MFIVTGAAGFIGSCLVNKLNNKGITDIILVDDFSSHDKAKNLDHKIFSQQVHRDAFFSWLEQQKQRPAFILHIGARTDTTEFDRSVFEKLNLNYSKRVWNYAARHEVPLIYASSAATYGMGELGYKDDHDLVPRLKPLNPYGESKNDFDRWVLEQTEQPPFWAGLKFFNVYGPNEYHKKRMASVIFHAFHQIMDTGKVRLFKSHRPDYEDGKQLRDFIYVKDVVDVIYYLMNGRPASGIYNLGTGQARSFLDLAKATFHALNLGPVIEFIDTPVDIREKYQYYTCAVMDKLHSAGYSLPFYTLEEGITEYVEGFLQEQKYF